MSPSHGKRPAGLQSRSSKAKRLSGNGLPKVKHVQIKDDDPEEAMASSFNPFCTYCERQIVTPSNSILYCSESCRRRDQNKSLSSTSQSPPLTPLQPSPFDDLPVRDIVPQRSPTAITNNRFSYYEPSEEGVQISEDEKRRPRLKSQDSEAARYLRLFYSTEAQAEMVSRKPRPRYNRSSTSVTELGTVPSLSDSPSSTDAVPMPYTPSSRPLPTRYNPFSSSYGTRTVDLVTPFAIMQPKMPTTAPSSFTCAYSYQSRSAIDLSTGFAEAGVTYERRASIPSSSPHHGSLKQMFRFSEMQAPPTCNEA